MIEEIIDAKFYDKDGNVIMYYEPENMRIDVSQGHVGTTSLYAPRRMNVTFDVKQMNIYQVVDNAATVDEKPFPQNNKEFVKI